MRCENIKSLILDYAVDELGEENRINVETHIKNCEECNRFFNLADNQWKLLDEWESIEPRADYLTNFWDRISNEELRDKRKFLKVFKFWKPNWSMVSALSVFLVVGVISTILITSNNYDVAYTESDKVDEEILFDLDRTISISDTDLLEVYGAWDVGDTQENGG